MLTPGLNRWGQTLLHFGTMDSWEPAPFTSGLARQIKTKGFRHALAVPQNASLYIGPEGGLHHGVASVGVAAVVLFGDFIPPAVTGYSHHANLTGGGDGARKMG